MGARLTTLLIWAAVLGCAVAWGLPLFTRATPVPAGASLAAPAPPAGGSLVRLLGQAPVAPVVEAPEVAAASRFQLVGVVAARQVGGQGLALIAVDGKPAKPVRVGREVEPGLKLLTVAHRQVELGAGPGVPSVTLTLAPLPEAQRGRPDALPGMAPPMPAVAGAMPGVMQGGMPGVMPGVMRVPPMVQPPRPVPGAPLPAVVQQQPGMLPYQGDNPPDVQPQGGGMAPMR
jgi:general secretion pathway protein C